jgi:hypothetical protein
MTSMYVFAHMVKEHNNILCGRKESSISIYVDKINNLERILSLINLWIRGLKMCPKHLCHNMDGFSSFLLHLDPIINRQFICIQHIQSITQNSKTDFHCQN